MVTFQLIRMSSYAKNKLQIQSPKISVDVVKWAGNFHKFTLYIHYLSVTKNDLSSLNNQFMVRFQLISMSSHAKNKLQMCSVTVDVANCAGTFQKFTLYTHFLSVTKMTSLD